MSKKIICILKKKKRTQTLNKGFMNDQSQCFSIEFAVLGFTERLANSVWAWNRSVLVILVVEVSSRFQSINVPFIHT